MRQETAMSRITQLKNICKRFANDQKGTVAVLSALVAIPLFLATGAAVDFARFNGAQTHVQTALDAAALAGATGKDLSDAQRIAAAQLMFDNNMARGIAHSMDVKATFKVEDDRIISSAELIMPTSLMVLAGFENLKDHVTAEVGILGDKKAEIALVLDYSGSMWETAGGKVKYVAMKDAAKGLVEDLAESDPDKVKFGLVPFSHHVYTTLPGASVLGGGGGSWTGCTQDREYPSNVSDATPTGAAGSKWNQPMYNDADQLAYNCSGYVANNLKTVDLTDNFKAVTNQLKVMKPYAYTHIALGVEFGYHMLSPNAPFTKGAAYDDKNVKKFMVVLTDGAQTAGAFGPGGVRNPEQGNANLTKLCNSAKANGITIITMAFDLDDEATRDRLKACASDPYKDFFVAEDSADLARAFDSLKAAITAEVYLRK
jgi:Flp pilus assembly protein TadG